MTDSQASPKELLQKYWAHTEFRGSQERIIKNVLKGQDTLALMPTGGGKSVCFQLPALRVDGITLVVSPLVALIQDQVAKLRDKGIKAVAMTGRLRRDEVIQILDNATYGNYKLLYLSPERLQQDWILKRIGELNVSLIAIDEAHCISQWGHDFRPAYLECTRLRDLHPIAPVIALTATATEAVTKEIIDLLRLKNAEVVKDSFDRPNLTYVVQGHHNKNKALVDLVRTTSNSVIVYVRTRRQCKVLADILHTNDISAAYYHGGLDKAVKKDAMKAWLRDKVQVMVATTAFGMGIDKPDVSLVIHYAIPESVESYFQEAGRAGRDGHPARAVLIHSPSDIDQARRQFTAHVPGTSEIKQVYKLMMNSLQVAYGEGAGESFPFDFQDFCSHYELPHHMVYETLKTLDRLGIVLVSEDFQNKTTFRYTIGKEDLWNYMETQPGLRTFHETLVRSYGGIFDHAIPLNVKVLAKRMGSSVHDVYRSIKRAHSDQIALVEIRETDLILTLLMPREDDRTILPFKSLIEKNKKRKIRRLDDMIRYVTHSTACRSRLLLSYFGESAVKDCGNCDLCKRKEYLPGDQLEGYKDKILKMLQQRVMTLTDIHLALHESKEDASQCIRELLEDEKIAVNEQNQYYPL